MAAAERSLKLTARAARRSAPWLSLGLRLTLGLLLTAVVVRSALRQLPDDAAARPEPLLLAAGSLLLFAVLPVRAWRWICVSRSMGLTVPGFREALHATTAALFVANWLPGRLGELSRPAFAAGARHACLDATVAEFLAEAQVLIALGALGLWWLVPAASGANAAWPLIACALVLSAFCLPGPRRWAADRLVARAGLADGRVAHSLCRTGAVGFGAWLRAVLFGLVSQGIGYATAYLTFRAFGAHVGPLVLASSLAAGKLAGHLSMLPWGLGAREAASVALLSAAGVPPGLSAVCMIALRAQQLAVSLPGLWSVLLRRTGRALPEGAA